MLRLLTGDKALTSATTVVTVSYNSSAVLRKMLESVVGQAECVVVDNGGNDNLAPLAAEFGALLVRRDQNEGFGRGCNAGATQARTEFLFFVNPDVVLGQGCIAALETAARRLPDLVAANPLVLDGRGRAQFKTTSILLPGGGIRKAVPAMAEPVLILTGCALFVRRSLFERIGGFDPSIFLYHEDHDIAIRLGQYGTLWHIPEAQVRHIAGTGAPRTAAWFKGYHMARSRCYVLHKYRRPLPFLRAFVPAVGGLFLPHNLFSKRRRLRSLGQIVGALSAWRDKGVYLPR